MNAETLKPAVEDLIAKVVGEKRSKLSTDIMPTM